MQFGMNLKHIGLSAEVSDLIASVEGSCLAVLSTIPAADNLMLAVRLTFPSGRIEQINLPIEGLSRNGCIAVQDAVFELANNYSMGWQARHQ